VVEAPCVSDWDAEKAEHWSARDVWGSRSHRGPKGPSTPPATLEGIHALLLRSGFIAHVMSLQHVDVRAARS
jgi:hypothetical protein